jgi:hypothetical protein
MKQLSLWFALLSCAVLAVLLPESWQKESFLTALHKLDKPLYATVMKEMETLLRSETMKRLLSERLTIMIMLRNINYLPK